METFNYKTFSQALVSNNVGQLKKTSKFCHEMLKINPNNAGFMHVIGIIEYRFNHNELASKWLKKAMKIMPDSAEINYNYAQIMLTQKKYQEALKAFKRAIVLKADYAEAYNGVGSIYNVYGDYTNAIEFYNKALAIKPEFPQVLNDFGVIWKNSGNLLEAENCYKRALAILPNYPPALYNLGLVYFFMGNLDKAENYYRRVLTIKPNYYRAINNLGMVFRCRGEFAKSIVLYTKALALHPEFHEALNNLGTALRDSGKLQEAISIYEKALILKENSPECHNNLAMALLAAGRFDEGWRQYEWRWQTAHLKCYDTAKPLWQGEAVAGRILLIRSEQGFGDTLQFCRYAPLAAAQGLHVIFEVQPALVGLMRSLSGVEKVIPIGNPLPDFDFYCPTMSLPVAFNTKVETIPSNGPYLFAAPEAINNWRKKLPENSGKMLRVGLAWAGSSRTNSIELVSVDSRRSINFELLAPLMDIVGIQFFSLQKTGPSVPTKFGLIDLMAECCDFADTAALIANLDLVISVDTAVAHLAGALGKPVWILNRFDSCWRWMETREDSPWYPTLRLFRQTAPGDWNSVVLRVKHELNMEAAKRVRASGRFVAKDAPEIRINKNTLNDSFSESNKLYAEDE